MKSAVILTAHGTVEDLDDLAPFIANIRRGHTPPAAIVEEVRRRYEAIGGKSPLLDHTRTLAAKVEARLGVPVKIAMRLWHPYPHEVVPALAGEGVRQIAVVPLAQFSSSIYVDAIAKAASAVDPAIEVKGPPNWGSNEGLVKAQAKRVRDAVERLSPEARLHALILFSAHSLPKVLVDQGDTYEQDFRASVEAIVRELGPDAPPHLVAFQSQGLSAPGERHVVWLGPELAPTLDLAKARGAKHIVFAPVGFLADHVEVLYDLDLEAAGWAKERGLGASRIESLNAADDFADVVASLAKPLLAPTSPEQ